ncbi:response regulator [Methylomonas sp. AM2-LC]|uniref:response regulator n=1 Tax=Methylomonas sp. AM2-LC TaxID=3153301 RepID=UPI00326498E4
MQQAKILIVDDDLRIRSLLKRYLSQQGFVVSGVGDALEMTMKLERDPIDLIVLDWMLPGEQGLSICQRLSADKNNPPIIMLTANGSAESRISGLDGGADDYLPKPFEPRELVARIHAVLRRRPRVAAAIPIANSSSLYFGPYRLDSTQRCLYREDAQIALTGNEFALLNVLAQHAGTPLSRERLAYLINGRDHDYENRSLDVQVSRLRRLLEDDPARPCYLQTVRGRGYMLTQQQDELA